MYEEKKIAPRENLREQLAIREDAVRALLGTIPGEDPNREGLLETPHRVAMMYEELFGGYEMDPHQILSKTFDKGFDDEDESPGDVFNGIVIVRDIQFYSQCEHHMVPFMGKVHVAYIPKARVVGLSKIARLVECFARRLQIQEKMTRQIADAIKNELDAQGVMVVVQAHHLCMESRGAKKRAETVTSSVYGTFAENNIAREEALALLEIRR